MLEMQISTKGIVEIATYEGICLKPYYDSVHVITVGLGSTVTDIPDLHSWPLNRSITVQQAFSYFTTSLQRYVDAINTNLANPVYQYQFDALVSICYNIGCSGAEHSQFLADINANDDLSTISAAIMHWSRPPEIIPRRRKEAKLYCTGIYSSNGMIQMIDTDDHGHQLIHSAHDINAWDYLSE